LRYRVSLILLQLEEVKAAANQPRAEKLYARLPGGTVRPRME
jgi:hypothetical protein